MEGIQALMGLRAGMATEGRKRGGDDNNPLSGMEKMARLLGGKKQKDGDKGKSAIRLLYDSSRLWMFDVADSLTRGMIRDNDDGNFFPSVKEPELPGIEVWDLKLGDTVKIKYSRKDFKWMQQKTLGWSKRLNQIYGHIGVINSVISKYDNSIGVDFPEQYASCTLYAGVLEKVPPPEYPNLNPKWKVGDFVQTISCKKTLKLLQRGLDQIPEELRGVKGRVAAVTHPSVLVTFDERKTYDLKSGSLVECKDKSPLIREEIKHSREIKVGDEVTVKSNLKILIENQEEFGGWNPAMCDIRGKKVTVIHIQKDGSLNVQVKHSRAWRINPDSVLRSDEEESEEDDFKFFPGDIIKLKVPANSRAIFDIADVPMVFLEYMRSTAVLAFIDDDLDYLVRFNASQNVQTDEDLVRRASVEDKLEYESIKNKVEELKAGDRVHLDIGPPNYVQAMIRELDLHPSVAVAMVKSATLLGFIDYHTAVIEYENGVRFRVKKKYLTVPEKFQMVKSKTSITPDVIKMIYNAITKSLQTIHSEMSVTKDWEVELTFMSRGNPPCIEYKIESTVATFDPVFKWFDEHSGWNVEALGDRQFFLKGITEANLEIKVGIIFNDEESVCNDHEAHGGLNVGEVSTKNETESAEKDEKRPQVEEKPPSGVTVDDFKYIKLYDRALAKNVYFPYIVRGAVRTPIKECDDNYKSAGSSFYIDNKGGNVNIYNNNN